MATLADLVKSVSQGTYFNNLMAKHAANGVPTKSWLSVVNTGLSLTQIAAEMFAELRESVRLHASAQFLDYADGEGLDLFAKSAYQIDPYPAQFTKGRMVLASVAGAPSYTFAAGDITVGTPGPSTSSTRLFTNTTGGTLNPNGTLTLDFIATQPGAEWNIPPGSPLDLKTSFAGVSVTNPAIGLTGTWITSQGAPKEEKDRIKARCYTRWSTLGAGGNDEALTYWALQAPSGYTSSPVKSVKVLSNYLNGTIAGNGCTVVLIGPAGALPNPDIDAVAGNFQNPKKYALGTILQVTTAINRSIPIVGVVNIFRSAGVTIAEVQAAIVASAAVYQGTLKINQTIYPQRRVAGALVDNATPYQGAIRDIDLSAMQPSVPVALLEYPVLDLTALAFALVD